MGNLGKFNFPGVNDDQFGTLLPDRLLDSQCDDGMILCGIAAGDQEHLRLLYLLNGIGHGSTAECGDKTCHRHGVSEPGTVVNVIGSHCRPHKFLKEVVLFIGNLGRTETGNTVTSVLFLYLTQLG